jgi:hypothetical protein
LQEDAETPAPKVIERRTGPFLAPIADPLADEKLTKKLLKLVKKASKRKQTKRGVKEVVKAIRKKFKGCAKRRCVLSLQMSSKPVLVMFLHLMSFSA